MSSYPTASIDLSALQHNFQRVKQLAPNSKVMSVIKANAYGHGMVEAAQALKQSDAFAVARLSEALRLRRAGIEQSIVILEGVNNAGELQLASQYTISLVFHSQRQIDLLTQTELGQPLRFCWLMFETGMHRLGLSESELKPALETLSSSANISGPIGLMSHFANADVQADKRNDRQLELISVLAEQLGLVTSMANSAAILSLPESHGDWVRPGIMLYGSSPFDEQTAESLDLKSVMQLRSIITAIKTVEAGQQVGYGGDWTAKVATNIAIVSIGYGDGYSRQLSNTGKVSVNGQIVDVLGRVSMDMIAINVTDCSQVAIGDEVILWGSPELTIDAMAKSAQTISYELLCQLNERVPRDYING